MVDLIVIGGGINGCGVARDAAGRGLSVVLCEMGDLAGSTSSWSTKLIHGGLRYLEYYEFRLVREALTEREVLWALAPHIIRPMRFVLPHRPGLRAAWVLRLGLFLYDHIGGRKRLRGTRTLRLDSDPLGRPLKPGVFAKGFEYSDCRVDDSRLVVLNARDAADRGAEIRCRALVESAEREADHWVVRVRDQRTGAVDTLRSRALINAAGPWVENVLSGRLLLKPKARIRLVQGSHIVVRKLYDHDRAYILQNPDGRIVFTIPFEGAIHADRHHRPRLRGRSRQGDGFGRGSRVSLRGRVAKLRAAGDGRRRRLELFRRAPPLRRRRERSQGSDPRLRARGRRRRARAGRLHLRREDHDLSAPRRGSASPPRAGPAAARRQEGLDGERAAPGRRFPGRRTAGSRANSRPVLSVPRGDATFHGSRAPTARGLAACWAPRASGRISERALETR